MREALLRKRYGIPAALLALLVLTGVATAFVVHNFTFTAPASEPLSFSIDDGLVITYQGDSDEITVEATNHSAETDYGIFVNATADPAKIDSITYAASRGVGSLGSEQKNGEDVNGDGDRLDGLYNISAGDTGDIHITVDTTDDGPSGELKVTLEFHRKTEYY